MNESDRIKSAVSRETNSRFAAYCDLLEGWNKKINLVSARDLSALYERHILDSAQIYPHAPLEAQTWIDFGTGAGFPGLICAMLAADEARPTSFYLIESDNRKAAFLREAVRITGVKATVISARIETISPSPKDVVSARALASLDTLLEYAWPFIHSGTCLLFLKGQRAESELTEARHRWHITADLIPSRTDASGTLLKLTGVSRRK